MSEGGERRRDEAATEVHDPVLPRKLTRAIYVAVAIVALTLVVVDVTAVRGWEVDDTAVMLLGLVVVLPLVEQLRKFKVGSLEVELDAVRRELGDVRHQVQREAVAASREILDEESGERAADMRVAGETLTRSGVEPRVPAIDRIVWVDDDPAGNAAYAGELRRRYPVEQVPSTEAGLTAIREAPERTLVITDAVRREGDRMNYEAGLQLLEALSAEHPLVPVVVFAGSRTVAERGQELRAAGAQLVTDSFVELSAIVRDVVHRRFKAEVMALARAAGPVQPDPDIDAVVLLADGTRMGIEAKDWRRRPTREARMRLWQTFAGLLAAERIDAGLVIVPGEQVAAKLPDVPAGVDVVTVRDAESRLAAN